MRRFQINAERIQNGSILLDERESHHAISVLRLKASQTVRLMDGKGNLFMGVIAGLENGRVRVRVDEGRPSESARSLLPVQITIAVSVIKPERMELLIQKACELGVTAIIPVRSDRSIIKLSKERWEDKIVRWRKIAAESCKQCGLPTTPRIHETADLKDVLSDAESYDQILIPTLEGATRSLCETLKKSAPGKLLALIGPEGDFSPKEVECAISCGAEPVSLGPLVLRTETAALYLLSTLSFFYREVYPHAGAFNE